MIVCCTSLRSAGCTFLDWSIHFLAGREQYFHAAYGWSPLISNPVVKNNAHNHVKNHPSGFEQTQRLLSQLKQCPDLTSFYPILLHPDVVAEKLKIDLNLLTPKQWQLISEYRLTDYNQCLQHVHNSGTKIIFMSIADHLTVYTNSIRSLDRLPFANRSARSTEDLVDNVNQIFFKKDINQWNNLGLNNIWDLREQRALQSNLLVNPELGVVKLDFDHYWLDSQNFWYNGKQEIQKIMTWVGLDIDQNRFELWKSIYHDWQQVQFNILQFQYNYQHIVDSIINNWYYKIDLTFEQEVIIQHCLIYQHNLNLKTWQLEKFPSNTQDLHKLLEPNIHPL